MIVLKGDIVRLTAGDVGEVTEVWGIARTFLRLKRPSEKHPIIVFESQVTEVIQRNQKNTKERSKKK